MRSGLRSGYRQAGLWQCLEGCKVWWDCFESFGSFITKGDKSESSDKDMCIAICTIMCGNF